MMSDIKGVSVLHFPKGFRDRLFIDYFYGRTNKYFNEKKTDSSDPIKNIRQLLRYSFFNDALSVNGFPLIAIGGDLFTVKLKLPKNSFENVNIDTDLYGINKQHDNYIEHYVYNIIGNKSEYSIVKKIIDSKKEKEIDISYNVAKEKGDSELTVDMIIISCNMEMKEHRIWGEVIRSFRALIKKDYSDAICRMSNAVEYSAKDFFCDWQKTQYTLITKELNLLLDDTKKPSVEKDIILEVNRLRLFRNCCVHNGIRDYDIVNFILDEVKVNANKKFNSKLEEGLRELAKCKMFEKDMLLITENYILELLLAGLIMIYYFDLDIPKKEYDNNFFLENDKLQERIEEEMINKSENAIRELKKITE